MAGVVIPVIVHLWNDRRGKVLRVGSVALLTETTRRLSWSSRLTQILLLVVRCLLVMALALLLARPSWVSRGAGGKGWVLVAGSDIMADSFVKAGWERHVIDSAANYWEEFRQMDSLAPAGVPFYVFTPGLARRFAGPRPVTGREVHWKVYTPGDSVHQWLESVWRVSADSIVVTRGNSRSTGTQFGRERVATRAAVFEGVTVDTSALEVVVDGGNKEQRGYMVAALKALGEYVGRRVKTDSGRVVRWRPEWEEAAWDGRLPALLGLAVFGDGVGRFDDRVLDPEQIAPMRVKGEMIEASAVRVDVRPVLWGLVFLLFLLERIMIFRNGKA